MNDYTAHVDTFARDNLPPRAAWPDFINLDQLGYGPRLNCAVELLDRAVEEGDGDRVVLRSPELTWSYRELQAHADRIARVLVQDLGLVPGERVLLRAPNNPWMVACWFGVVKAGGIVVATMPLLRAPELEKIIAKARTRLALCDTRLLDELASAQHSQPLLERVVDFNGGELERLMERHPAGFDALYTAADDVCMIAFTSGTTGQPKGTMHFHRDVLAVCDTFSREVLRPSRDDLFMGSPPLAFTFGLGGLTLFPMRARAATALVEQVAPPDLLAAVTRFRPTVLFTSPTAYRALLDTLDPADITSLRLCVSAGETLPKPTSDAWFDRTGLRIIDGIGSTELLHIFISAAGDAVRPGATGVAVPGYEARVIDENGAPLPPGAPGRLAVRGPTGCRYLDDPRQADYVVDGWNVTGDTYLQDEDGYFWFQARSDDMIISAGYNIAGPEVEAALLGHEAVAECAVVGSPDDRRGEIVKAFIVPREPAAAGDALAAELQAYVKQAIAPYKYPRAVEFIDTLPRTETGKVQRFKLRQLELERARG
ncbi:MAG: AMP-binding protein [Gammaproteobacteria bacterium]|jgi:2-aminobenzoate-CoA ligase|nr:AMP-binding protein [Gammaproteobacteria bacterium]